VALVRPCSRAWNDADPFVPHPLRRGDGNGCVAGRPRSAADRLGCDVSPVDLSFVIAATGSGEERRCKPAGVRNDAKFSSLLNARQTCARAALMTECDKLVMSPAAIEPDGRLP
jgi:hypothetical protein